MPKSSRSESHAPTTLNVSQNTSAMMATNAGMAVNVPVSNLSSAMLRACSRLSRGLTTHSSHTFPMKANRMSAMAAARSRPRSASIWRTMCSSMSFSFWSSRSCLQHERVALGQLARGEPHGDARRARRGRPTRRHDAVEAAVHRAPCASAAQKSWRTGGSWNRATCSAWSIELGDALALRRPRWAPRGCPAAPPARSRGRCRRWPATSSIMLRANTMGTPSSKSCMVRYRLRSTFVASTMLMMPRGCPSSRKPPRDHLLAGVWRQGVDARQVRDRALPHGRGCARPCGPP